MIHVQKHLSILGMEVVDCVTGYTGIVTSVSFDLYGCIQALIHPGTDKDKKLVDQTWFDIGRLKILETEPVMDIPNFEHGEVAKGKKGPALKPLQTKA